MYSNNEFNFGISAKAQVYNAETNSFIKEIKIEIEQHQSEDAEFVGGGIASGGIGTTVFTFDNVDDIVPYKAYFIVLGVRYMLTSKQKSPLKQPRRFSFKKPRKQTYMTLE